MGSHGKASEGRCSERKENTFTFFFLIKGTSVSQLGVIKAEAETEKTLGYILSFILSSFLCCLRI